MMDYIRVTVFYVFFFQAEDGIRDLVRSRGLGDVYKRQDYPGKYNVEKIKQSGFIAQEVEQAAEASGYSFSGCLLYTSDAADERSSVDLGGRRIIKKKKQSITHV